MTEGSGCRYSSLLVLTFDSSVLAALEPADEVAGPDERVWSSSIQFGCGRMLGSPISECSTEEIRASAYRRTHSNIPGFGASAILLLFVVVVETRTVLVREGNQRSINVELEVASDKDLMRGVILAAPTNVCEVRRRR